MSLGWGSKAEVVAAGAAAGAAAVVSGLPAEVVLLAVEPALTRTATNTTMPTMNRKIPAATPAVILVTRNWRLRFGGGAPGSKPMVRLTNSACSGVSTMSGFHLYPGGGALVGPHPGVCGVWSLMG